AEDLKLRQLPWRFENLIDVHALRQRAGPLKRIVCLRVAIRARGSQDQDAWLRHVKTSPVVVASSESSKQLSYQSSGACQAAFKAFKSASIKVRPRAAILSVAGSMTVPIGKNVTPDICRSNASVELRG